jgi:hypothetical protein
MRFVFDDFRLLDRSQRNAQIRCCCVTYFSEETIQHLCPLLASNESLLLVVGLELVHMGFTATHDHPPHLSFFFRMDRAEFSLEVQCLCDFQSHIYDASWYSAPYQVVEELQTHGGYRKREQIIKSAYTYTTIKKRMQKKDEGCLRVYTEQKKGCKKGGGKFKSTQRAQKRIQKKDKGCLNVYTHQKKGCRKGRGELRSIQRSQKGNQKEKKGCIYVHK